MQRQDVDDDGVGNEAADGGLDEEGGAGGGRSKRNINRRLALQQAAIVHEPSPSKAFPANFWGWAACG